MIISTYYGHDRGAKIKSTVKGSTWVKKRIKRTANRLFLGSEHRGFQLIKSVKKTNLNIYVYFYLYLYHFPLIKSE